MRKILALPILLILLSWLPLATAKADPVYQSQTIACTRSAQFNGAAATTVLVPNVAGKQIYVCGFVFAGSAAGTAGLIYGVAGSTCATTPQPVTPVFAVGAATNPGIVDHQTYYAGLPPAPAGNDLCAITTGTAQVIVYYAQF